MKKLILASLLVISTVAFGFSQTREVKPANPADVDSVESVMRAVYDVISGEAGQKRDWDRFRSLFHKDARLIPTGKNTQTGMFVARSLTPEDYITRSGPVLEKDGFFEIETARRMETFGNIAHVFSTYEARRSKSDKKPFMRGINSFQLLNDGKRWWVVTIYWQAESPELPIPKKYLKSK
jgi:hypothetical protein